MNITNLSNVLTQKIKHLVEILDMHGHLTTSNWKECPELDIVDFETIRRAYIDWATTHDELPHEQKVSSYKYLAGVVRGTCGLEYRFERISGQSMLGTIHLTDKARMKHFEIRIHNL